MSGHVDNQVLPLSLFSVYNNNQSLWNYLARLASHVEPRSNQNWLLSTGQPLTPHQWDEGEKQKS